MGQHTKIIKAVDAYPTAPTFDRGMCRATHAAFGITAFLSLY